MPTTPASHERGRRRLHRRAEHGVSRARSDAGRRDAGAPRHRAGGGLRRPRRSRRARADSRPCNSRDSRGCSASPAPSTRPRAASPSGSPTPCWPSSSRSRCRAGPASTPLPGGSLRDIGLAIADARREFDEGLPTDTIPHLIAAYGSRYRDVMEIAGNRSGVADAPGARLTRHRRGAGARGAERDGADAGRHRHPADAARRARTSWRSGAGARSRDRRRRTGLVRGTPPR